MDFQIEVENRFLRHCIRIWLEKEQNLFPRVVFNFNKNVSMCIERFISWESFFFTKINQYIIE